MPEFSMPFNSVPMEDGTEDRLYYAEDFARIFSHFLSTGVYPNPSSGLRVDAVGSNMKLWVRAGSAIIKGHSYALYDEDMQVAVSPAHMVYSRKDAIVVQLNLTERIIRVLYKEGKASTSPTPPELIRNEDIYELRLGEILVKSGVQVITQAEITDTRANGNVCGYVTHVVKSIDTTAIYKQYETYLNQRIAAWNSRENQQTTDWRNQMNTQQTTFDQKTTEIGEWYADIRANISKLQTFDFDNLVGVPGCMRVTTKESNGFREIIKNTSSNKKVAERVTTKTATGFTEAIKIYEEDGTSIMKSFTITTTKTATGFEERVVG